MDKVAMLVPMREHAVICSYEQVLNEYLAPSIRPCLQLFVTATR